MSLYVLKRVQRLRVSLDEAWSFFSNPTNLSRITPPDMDFSIVSDTPDEIHEGLIIEYRVRPLLSIPVTWITEITHVKEPYYFTDEQRIGPYRIWHHEHRFDKIEGGTEMTDTVHYVLPFGFIGDIIHSLIVRRRLIRIFDFRREYLRDKFGEIEQN